MIIFAGVFLSIQVFYTEKIYWSTTEIWVFETENGLIVRISEFQECPDSGGMGSRSEMICADLPTRSGPTCFAYGSHTDLSTCVFGFYWT
jgi:hypothetical protein